ncbi:uncharacterized protein JN550_008959 [Neoarthrinium moseri]|uniref:uncharacterized protein n=1 Tax=Neoarthrinium moseri TaxID=1658444 RepID=UPI001FDCC384|nr:uncharacterized protein JN550_008959 [Neoarthrinium moseri]KAI1864402.1 hypothetical protein JN550_008959 [Neoarthrinium moseri]
MPSSPSSRITATSIPNITALRVGLDYGDPRLTRCSTFTDDLRGFRKKFVTSTGLPGPDLHEWKLKEHQAGLDEMTAAYLDRDGNGPLYWPDSETSPNYNKLRYSRDQPRIKRLMKQLFFRLNQQQYRNKRYKSNYNKKRSIEPSVEPQARGQSSENPIDVDELSDSENLPVSPRPDRPIPSTETTRPEFSRDSETTNASRKVKVESFDDPYSFPQTPEPVEQHAAKRNKVSGKTVGDNKTPANGHRPTVDSVPESATPPKRVSERPKRPVHREGFSGLEAMDEALNGSDIDAAPQSSWAPLEADPTVGVDDPAVRVPPTMATSSNPGIQAQTEYLNAAKTVALEDSQQPQPQQQYEPQQQAEDVLRVSRVSASAQVHPEERPPTQEQTASAEAKQKEAIDTPASPAQPVINVSTDHPLHKDMDPSTASTHREELHQTSEKPEVKPERQQQPRTLPKPRIDFIYRVVLSRRPIYSYRSWTPTWKLEQTTLGQIIAELDLAADARGVIFTVEGPGFRAVEEFLRADENRFTVFVKQIKRVVRSQLASGKGVESPLTFEIEIEPMQADTAGSDDEYDDDFTI